MHFFLQLFIAFVLLFTAAIPAVSQPAANATRQAKLPGREKQAHTPVAKQAQPEFTYKIIEGINGSFGYDIYADGRLKLHQPSIPAMPGNEGFKTKAAAEQVAQLAIKKMQKGESLPTISPDELKKLKVI